MTSEFGKLDLNTAGVLLAGLSVLWLLTGYYFSRNNKTFDDHALAGRKVGLALGTTTAVATWITSNTIMLAPQLTLEMGVWGMLAYSSACLGLVLFGPMAARIRDLMPHAYTSGDFIRLRYGNLAWLLYLLITIFYSLTWLVSMAMAAGILIETLSVFSYVAGMSVVLSVCVLYTINGGLAAVIGTDFVQSIIILIGLVIVGYCLLSQVSFDQMYAQVERDSPMLLTMFFPAALMAFFNNLLFGFGEVFHNNVWWSRAFAFREGVGKKAFILGGLIWFPIPIAAGFIALASGVLELPIPSPDMVGPLVITRILGDKGAILVFIVVFCSLASSIDSLLASISDLITEDIYRRLFRPEAISHHLKRSSQIITIGIGVLVWLLCLPRMGTLMTVLFFAGPLVGSLIWPIVCGLYWRNANAMGAVTAMVLGSAIGLVCYFSIAWYVATLVSTAVSMCCMVIFSKLQPVAFDWARLREH